MRRDAVFALLIAVLPAAIVGCGGTAAGGPAAVVDAWTKALDGGDDAAAAKLFAKDAIVVQAGRRLTLAGQAEALSFNASLPCGATVVSEQTAGSEVTATFTLTSRPGHRCDGTGQSAVTVFEVSGGKITLWHELPSNPAATQSA